MLVGRNPCHTKRWEETETLSGSEVLGAVVTEVGLEEITVVKRICAATGQTHASEWDSVIERSCSHV